MSVSRSFLAALLQRCRCLPCSPSVVTGDGGEYVDFTIVTTAWNEEAGHNLIVVGDVRRQADTNEMVHLMPRIAIHHPGSSTDLQVAQMQDSIIAVSSTSEGGVCLVKMQLPEVPGASNSHLQFVPAVDDADVEDDESAVGGAGNEQYLQHLPDLHAAGTAAVDINVTRQSLLTVSGDGSICIIPLDAGEQLSADCNFKAANGWSGYSQGRWADSNTFLTAGVLGGLQLWDIRQGPTAVSSSPISWGHTGCGYLDKQQGAARQLLSVCVHPSRPNVSATGASSGSVALWDLRFQSQPLAFTGSTAAAGDVWEVKFDPHEPLLYNTASVATPLLYCTSDGALCRARTTASSDALVSEVLLKEHCSLNSFDVEPTQGLDIVAATDNECMLLLHRAADDEQY